MADTQLKSIAIRNWASVREASIDFPDKGLILVQGLNSVSRGKLQSIGSGKTALGEAISRSLVGVPGRYAQLGHYSYKGEGDTLVVLNCLHKSKPLKIELGFKANELSKTGESLRFTYDNQEIWRDRIGNTREDLVRLLTVPPELAKWTVYLDGDQLRFDSLGQRTSVELLMAALNQPPWTEFHRQANSTASDMKRNLKASQALHERLQSDARQAANEWEAADTRLQEVKTVYKKQQAENEQKIATANADLAAHAAKHLANKKRLAEIRSLIDTHVKSYADRCHALEIERNRRSDELGNLKEAQAILQGKQNEAQSAVNRALGTLRKFQNEPKTCPTCGKPWESRHSEAVLTEARNEVEAAEAAFEEAAGCTAKHQIRVRAAGASVAEITAQLQQVKNEAAIEDHSLECQDLEQANETIQERLGSLERLKAALERGPDEGPVVRAEATLAERLRHKIRAQEALEESATKLVDDEEALRIAEYWKEAFGPTGIPNMVLADAIGPLNETSKRVSTLMTGGCIDVRYETCRELASGQDKAELTITVDNPTGAHRADGGSKGESSLTNLIIAETLAEVGGVATRLGYRWYDEVGANQDELVRRSIFAYLKETAHRYGILIFVVSHTPEVASYADYILIAEKTEKGTTYRWD